MFGAAALTASALAGFVGPSPGFPISAAMALLAAMLVGAEVRKYRRCRIALDNMWQGVAVYGAEGQLLLYNSQFCRMLGLPPVDVRRAATERDIVELSVAAGHHDGMGAEQVWGEDAAFIARRESALAYIDLPDQRTIARSHQPIAGGGWVRTYADVTARRETEALIVHMARHDGLTGLPNRTLFHERLDLALEGAGQRGSVAVLFLDLDQFKAVNDTLGHAFGDLLLQQVADRLRSIVPAGDTVARLGGDEFAIIQADVANATQSDALAERLIVALGEPYDVQGTKINIGASIGATFAPQDGVDAEKLLKNADMALYHAKSAGRGLHRFFEPEMDARVNRRRTLEADLRRALLGQLLEVHYQPLIDLRSFRVESFEALLRWPHPVHGMISPDEFIPIAEETGMIVELGAWVLREACRTAMDWPKDITVAVNVSSVQFRGELVNTVRETLSATGLEASRLELEITESVMLQESEATLVALRQLDELGVPITMDDFGTGYSSLNSLGRFRFQTIKVDRSFTQNVVSRPESLAIIRAVAQLGRSLGMKVTAEGIETRGQLARIMAEDCTVGQGYLFAHPMPREAISDFLKGWPPETFRPGRRALRKTASLFGEDEDDAA